MNTSMTKLISVDGNIGSGKSTLISILETHNKNTKIVYIQEPVKIWESIKDKDGINIIQKFYANQTEYSFSFQMMAYISRLSIIKKAKKENPGCILVSERSTFTDRHVFAKMLYDDNKIEEINYQIYLKWFDEFMEDFPITTVIFVKTPPEICQENIMKRNRTGETIDIDYLKRCDDYHYKWIEASDFNVYEVEGGFTESIVPVINVYMEKIIKQLKAEMLEAERLEYEHWGQ